MNYRHGYHAGNFADLVKHAALLAFLMANRETGRDLLVVDTHAGAGAYDLGNADFARSKEAEAGIKHLLASDVPAALRVLGGYVKAKNVAKGTLGADGQIGLYPGSPMMITDHLPAGGDYLGCELRKDDYQMLRDTLDGRGRAFLDDGYHIAVKTARRMSDEEAVRDLFLLIDPPFERADDYTRIVETLYDVLVIKEDAKALVWLPIKDLETLDAFARQLEPLTQQAKMTIAEVRLRPLLNPMKMNGCALVALNLGEAFDSALQPILDAAVAQFGEAGGMSKLWHLG